MIPFIKIEAKNHNEFGYKLGSSLKENIQFRIKQNKKAYEKNGLKDYPSLVKISRKFLPSIEKKYQDLLKEAKGISEGAEISFDDLIVLMCEEELIDLKIIKKIKIPHCTNIALKTSDNKVLLGHNEDWIPEYLKNGLVVTKGRINKKKFLSLNYMGSFPGTSCGLTSHGLAFTVNSLKFKKFRYQIPRSFQMAEILELNSPEDIMKVLDFSKSSISGNTILAWANSRIIDVEELWGHIEKFESHKWLIHTNHPLLKKDQTKKNTDVESLERYYRAVDILTKEKSLTLNTVKKVLSDHKAGVCTHNRNTLWTTIGSGIINPTDKWIEVCHKNPCKNKYKRYYLD